MNTQGEQGEVAAAAVQVEPVEAAPRVAVLWHRDLYTKTWLVCSAVVVGGGCSAFMA